MKTTILSVQSETILVVGATSGIAAALCRRLAAQGHRLILAARDSGSLEALAGELRAQSPAPADIVTLKFDALEFERVPGFLNEAMAPAAGVNGVLVCHGFLPDQPATERDAALARRTIDVNFTSAVVLLNGIAERLLHAKPASAWIAVITSVAGDRGRRENYLYGATKAGLTTFLQGFRSRLFPEGVHVLTIKPGYVGTKMLNDRAVKARWLVADPDRVARDILRAIRRRQYVLYTPWYWRPILWCARILPEWLFIRLKL